MNPLLTEPIARAEDSFIDAEFLFKHERYAGTINRCYYSIYYLVQGLLLLKRVHTKTHKGIIQKFSETYIVTKEFPERLGNILANVFQKRITADYDMNAHVTADDARQVMKETREFLDTVKEIA